MPNPVTISDLEARWRPLSDLEPVNAAAFLEDAWAELLSRRPTLESDITAGTVTAANVIRVVSAMVLRVLKNPEGYDQESIDDWSGRRNALVADGILRITPEELAAITPGRATRRSVRLVVYGDA
ncbi:MAG: hypothetical protein H0X12_04940 [Nocardioides sp.]|nr:hypothetical protein [Nocardioides sp.]